MSARSKKSSRSVKSRAKSPPAQPEENVSSFTPDQLLEYKEMFAVFDKDGDNKITMHEMYALVQACGYSAQESEIDDICSSLDQNGENLFSVDDFLKVAEHFNQQINMEEMLTTCCKVFFGEDTRIQQEKLQDILQTLGNPLTNDEIKQLFFNIFPDDEDEIEVSDFVNKILGKTTDEDDE